MPYSSASTTTADVDTVDVAIVGAGLSGAAAADRLLHLGVENFVVFEANDRAGGRVNSMTVAGATVDAGAQFVSPQHTALRQLLESYHLTLLPIHCDGNVVRPISSSDTDLIRFELALTRLADSIDIRCPWSHPDAASLDAMTVAKWARGIGVTNHDTLAYISSRIEGAIGGGGDHVSALWYAYFIAAAGGWAQQTGNTPESRIAAGADALPQRVFDRIGARFRTSTPIVCIERGDDSVVVRPAHGSPIAARRLIMACSPPEVDRVCFSPPLTEQRRALNTRWQMGASTKFAIAFEEPFWRPLGFSGQIFPTFDSPVGAVFDNSPVDAAGPGVLIGFLSARRRRMLPDHPDNRATLIEAHIHTSFADTRHPAIDYVEHHWDNEPWITGCMSPLPPGVLTDVGPCIRNNYGPVHFAGTETSEAFNGYMEGAVRAGQRSAAEVARQLTNAVHA